MYSAVINNVADSPDASPSLVLFAPCQSVLKGHCVTPQWEPFFSVQRCHTGAVNTQIGFQFGPNAPLLRCCRDKENTGELIASAAETR